VRWDVGLTTEPKTHTYRFDEGSEQCCDFDK